MYEGADYSGSYKVLERGSHDTWIQEFVLVRESLPRAKFLVTFFSNVLVTTPTTIKTIEAWCNILVKI